MKGFLSSILIALLIIPVFAAEQEEVRMDLQVNLFLKILRYDRNIGERGAQGIKMGVLYNPSDKNSIRTWENFQKEFEQLGEKTINSIPIFVIQVKGVEELSKAIENYNVNVLYIAQGFDSQLASILSTCQKETVLTLTGNPAYAEKGVAVGLGVKAGKPEIIINNQASKDAGANFGADILKLARVIK